MNNTNNIHTEPDSSHLGQAHGQEHLRTEHAAVANLRPLLEVRVVAEDLHRRLRVRVVRGLETNLSTYTITTEHTRATADTTHVIPQRSKNSSFPPTTRK